MIRIIQGRDDLFFSTLAVISSQLVPPQTTFCPLGFMEVPDHLPVVLLVSGRRSRKYVENALFYDSRDGKSYRPRASALYRVIARLGFSMVAASWMLTESPSVHFKVYSATFPGPAKIQVFLRPRIDDAVVAARTKQSLSFT